MDGKNFNIPSLFQQPSVNHSVPFYHLALAWREPEALTQFLLPRFVAKTQKLLSSYQSNHTTHETCTHSAEALTSKPSYRHKVTAS